MLAQIFSATALGLEAKLVTIEVDVQKRGLPGWNMVGLPEAAVREAKERVSAAIRNSGYQLPNRKTLVNLSPGNIKKSGVHFDLGIAVGLLTAWNMCKASGKHYLLASELSLDGKLLPIHSSLLFTLLAHEQDLDGVILSHGNLPEASLCKQMPLYGFSTLSEVVSFLNGELKSEPYICKSRNNIQTPHRNLSDVKGQALAKRALEIAAAGGHNVIMVGPPGTGKTMLAECFPSLLPNLNDEEQLSAAKVASLYGSKQIESILNGYAPFRAPHHSASYAGLVGGGNPPQLGEISLAHHGVLFLDEIAEFRSDVLESLRQPLESGIVNIARSKGRYSYPAKFQLIAAMNPCKCGYLGHKTKMCHCTMLQIKAYRRKISGPLSDRIDLHLQIQPVPHQALLEIKQEESSEIVKKRILAARKIQYERMGITNSRLSYDELKKYCKIDKKTETLMIAAMEKMHLSARIVHRTLKVARTIADLNKSQDILEKHFYEALTYRPTEADISE